MVNERISVPGILIAIERLPAAILQHRFVRCTSESQAAVARERLVVVLVYYDRHAARELGQAEIFQPRVAGLFALKRRSKGISHV